MSPAREFILKAIGHYYQSKNIRLDDKAEDTLLDFIHNPQTLVLQSCVECDNNLLLFSKIQGNVNKSVIFYKNLAQNLTDEDAASYMNIITLTTSAAESLYQSIRQIYSPLLATGNDLYSNKLQKNLLELESNLRVLTHGKNQENINVILSIEDEVDYWKTMGQKRDASKMEREASSAFCILFEDICEEIRSMLSSSMEEVRDSVENIGGILDDVWRCTSKPYSHDRMIHILDIVGHIICSLIQKSLSGTNLWKVQSMVDDAEILLLLTKSQNVMQTWISACKSLTETYWPNYALHTWNAKVYLPLFCINFQKRLQEVHDVRSTHNQLSKLLTQSEKQELKTDELFEPFQNINIWICSGPNQSWENAVSRFSANLRPAEMKIAEKLKPRMQNTSTKQMLYEFLRYKTLINRPLVKHTLSNELELFVSSLLTMLNTIQNQLDTDEIDVKMFHPPEMSSIVQQVQWAKQMEAKVKDIEVCVENYLKDYEDSNTLLKLASDLQKNLKAMYVQLHEEWCRDLQVQVKAGSLQLSKEKPVVEFSTSTQLMVVNFNPRLVRTELEARSLAALGLPPPAAAQALDELTSALRHARALQQVASFHNTLGERMITSTRPMMLQAALDLSALVQDQKPVFWNNEEQLFNYTQKLKEMVLKLESQNSYLTNQHVAIRNIVEKLMDTELLVKQSEWKKGIKDIRDLIEKVEANGYKNTALWRSHWDLQLYKALETQYIKALLSLHTHFPPMKVDLVLRGHKVTVQPPMEEIRVQHYHQLRRLVALPAHFVGLQQTITDGPSIFATIVDKHSWMGNKAVRQIEGVLLSLRRRCGEWARRAAAACVPRLDAEVRARLTRPQHWDLNFKACKAYGQSVAKIAFEDEKIEWITVCTARLRPDIEAGGRALWASLVTGLRDSCKEDCATLQTFMVRAHQLDSFQTSGDEQQTHSQAKRLAEIAAKQQAVRNDMPQMEEIVEDLKKKSHMLRTWGGDPSIDDTIKEWQKVREQMITHQQMFEHQTEIVKSSLSSEWENLNSTVEVWVSRWDQAKARMEETRDVQYEEMVDRCLKVFDAFNQYDKYVTDKDELLKECGKFNIEVNEPDVWKEAEKLKEYYMKLWMIFKQYNDDLESLGNQEWIVFHKKLHLLDEFVTKWNEQLEPFTTITLYIKQELEKYSDLTMALKYVRGTDFIERHWREVFSLVEIEYKKPETLQVRDLLSVSMNIKRQIKILQKISSSASSEATIRSALNDLEIWFAGARLAIIYYNDKAKRLSPIVKDFKELLSEIEERQWVVSSVSGEAGGAGGAGGAGSAAGAWEARLRAARLLLRAANHAQRRLESEKLRQR